MKAVVAAFNQEKALVGAFSVITNLRMELFEALAGIRGHLCFGQGRSVRKHSHHILVTTLFLSSAEFAPSPVTRTITAFLQQISNDSYPADRINTSITGKLPRLAQLTRCHT